MNGAKNKEVANMEIDALATLMLLKNVNAALLDGLKACLFILEKGEEISPERRNSLITSIKGLIEQGEKAFENAPVEH